MNQYVFATFYGSHAKNTVQMIRGHYLNSVKVFLLVEQFAHIFVSGATIKFCSGRILA